MKSPFLSIIFALLTISAFGQSHKIYGVLSGNNEVPPVVTSAAGSFVGTYDETTNTLDITVNFWGLADHTGMHIHEAPAGMNGGVIYNFGAAGGSAAVYNGAGIVLTDPQEVSLLADGLYINVHSSAYPGGEIRDQIKAIPVTAFDYTIDATLAPENEVPPSTCTGASGTASGCYSSANNLLIIEDLSFTLGSPFAGSPGAHIHDAPAGANGPIIPGGFLSNGDHALGNPGMLVGAVVLSDADEIDLLNGDLYFNVHSEQCPAGAVRDQINAVAIPPIPTMGQWGVGVLSLLLLIVGIVFIRKNKRQFNY
jgi:Cu/Zn superoxide dismutase